MENLYKILSTLPQGSHQEIEIGFGRVDGREAISISQGDDFVRVDLDSLADLIGALRDAQVIFRPSTIGVHPGQGQFDLGGA